MLTFPLHNAALDLKGKPPEQLPHGLLTIPPEVRSLVEMQRSNFRPEVFEANKQTFLNEDTVGWYFQHLYQEVLYRPTPEGPEVIAVGFEEVFALRKTMPVEEQRKLRHYAGN